MEDEPSLKDIFVGVLSYSKEAAVRKVVDDWIFPFFEAKTGKHASNRIMRRQVAEKIEQSLSKTLWITKGHALSLGEDGLDDDFATPPRFLVSRAFPQSRSNGQYTIRIVVYQKGATYNEHIIDLEDFMRDFVPYEEIGFEDFDA